MRPGTLLVLVVGLLFLVVAGSRILEVEAQSSEGEAEAVPLGEAVYERACATCHGIEGDGRIGPPLDGNLNLARADYVTAIILRGRDGMPPFHDRLTGAEVAAVAEYVRSAWGNQFAESVDEADDEAAGIEGDDDLMESDEEAAEAPEVELVSQWWGDEQEGVELYAQICARCHGEEGGGGFGPPLVRNDNLSDPQYVVGKILHGQGGMPAFEGLLTGQQVARVATFIRGTFGSHPEPVDANLVHSLMSTSALPGALRLSFFPANTRLSVVGPDRFVHFVSEGERGATLLSNLLPGSYTITATSEVFGPSVVEVTVRPLRRTTVTINLGPYAAENVAGNDRDARVWTAISDPTAQEAAAEAGGVHYRRSCAMCHGADGEGGIGPSLAGNATLENTEFVLNRILAGTSVMPSFANRLTPEQIATTATFERTSWGNDFGAVTAEQVAAQWEDEETPQVTLPESLLAGAEIYEESCAACHGGGGFGAVGPRLEGNPALANLPYTVSRIVMGGGGMPSFHGVLSTAEMAEVATFIREAWGNEFGPVGIFRAQNYHGGTSGAQQ